MSNEFATTAHNGLNSSNTNGMKESENKEHRKWSNICWYTASILLHLAKPNDT